ncbi:MAG: hypothetical protein KME03_08555 [Aphanocapsa lilacina HA4352-LM1]|jgi:hypothetical protein|nr:hypothetical protein [Aphanocapsa lilacina HA4352-LM1]
MMQIENPRSTLLRSYIIQVGEDWLMIPHTNPEFSKFKLVVTLVMTLIVVSHLNNSPQEAKAFTPELADQEARESINDYVFTSSLVMADLMKQTELEYFSLANAETLTDSNSKVQNPSVDESTSFGEIKGFEPYPDVKFNDICGGFNFDCRNSECYGSIQKC